MILQTVKELEAKNHFFLFIDKCHNSVINYGILVHIDSLYSSLLLHYYLVCMYMYVLCFRFTGNKIKKKKNMEICPLTIPSETLLVQVHMQNLNEICL